MITLYLQYHFIYRGFIKNVFQIKDKGLQDICPKLTIDHVLASVICSVVIGKRIYLKVMLYCIETRSLGGSILLNLGIVTSGIILNFAVFALLPYSDDILMLLAGIVGIVFLSDLDFVLGEWFGIQISKNHEEIDRSKSPELLTLKRNQLHIDTAYWWTLVALVLNLITFSLAYTHSYAYNCTALTDDVFSENTALIVKILCINFLVQLGWCCFSFITIPLVYLILKPSD